MASQAPASGCRTATEPHWEPPAENGLRMMVAVQCTAIEMATSRAPDLDAMEPKKRSRNRTASCGQNENETNQRPTRATLRKVAISDGDAMAPLASKYRTKVGLSYGRPCRMAETKARRRHEAAAAATVKLSEKTKQKKSRPCRTSRQSSPSDFHHRKALCRGPKNEKQTRTHNVCALSYGLLMAAIEPKPSQKRHTLSMEGYRPAQNKKIQ